jgi:hypothetical protein
MSRSLLDTTRPVLMALVALCGWGCGPSSSGMLTGSGGDSMTGGTGGTGGASSGLGGATETGTGGATGGARNIGGLSGTGGVFGTGGEKGAGGAMATGGTTQSGGATGNGGSTGSGGASGGSTGVGGHAGAGGADGEAGATGTGGQATGGAGSGGSSATGSGGSAPGTGGSPPAGSCGATPNALPFGCKFAWGVNGESPTTFDYVQFISNWAGYNIQSNGTFSSCDQCGWLKSTMANASQVPALIAYLIGYYGHALGYQDGNVNPNGPNLTNSMGPVLLGVDNASCPSGTICASNVVVKAYAWYAAQVYASNKKPILWLMEGDFIQYSIEGSSTGLSYDQLGQLAAQITNAIKCNDPAAIIAWNYSTWISTSQRDSYFNALNTNMAKLGTSYEMVFTTGVGSSASAGTGTTWAQLYTAAGNKPIYSDESFGLSAAGDSWANQSAATIDARIAGHVVAADITTATPSYLQSNLTSTLAPSALNTTCF